MPVRLDRLAGTQNSCTYRAPVQTDADLNTDAKKHIIGVTAFESHQVKNFFGPVFFVWSLMGSHLYTGHRFRDRVVSRGSDVSERSVPVIEEISAGSAREGVPFQQVTSSPFWGELVPTKTGWHDDIRPTTYRAGESRLRTPWTRWSGRAPGGC